MGDQALFRPTRAEIDLGRIERNVRRLCSLAAGKGLRLIAVVKANGYGHGAPQVARASLAAGAEMLAVALVEEGIALRRAGIDAPILVLGAYVLGTAQAYVEHRLTPTLTDIEQVLDLDAALDASSRGASNAAVRVHLKVDTGMGRLGALPVAVPALAEAVRKSRRLEIEGVYSHLATGDEPEMDYARAQIETFHGVLDTLRDMGVSPAVRHILNSGGLLQHDPGETNFARVGLALYGMYPSPHLSQVVPLEPALRLCTRVATVKRVPAGSYVSYGRRYRTSRETQLATLPIGYADGFSRRLSGRAQVLIRGRRYPVVGRICMDQAVVDVGDDPVAPGDEAVLLGEQGEASIPVEEWAEALETINYEVVTMISGRVPRIYR